MDQTADKLRTEIRSLPVAQLRHLERNARYMTSEQQARLTANIAEDGGLTSTPLVWLMQTEDGVPLSDPATYLIVSENHRVISARDSGIEAVDCIVILNYISEARRIEIQLAHNAVSGQDDLSVLERLYEGLSLGGKEYSGLTDDLFKGLKDISLAGFGVGSPQYQEITLTFLPDDAAQFEAMVKRLGKEAKAIVHVASFEAFDRLFETIVRTKEKMNIQNNAVALSVMAELANQRLDELARKGSALPDQASDDREVIDG